MLEKEGHNFYGQFIYDRASKQATRVEILLRTDRNSGNIHTYLDHMGTAGMLSLLKSQLNASKIIWEKFGLIPAINIKSALFMDDNSRKFMMGMLLECNIPLVIELRESLQFPDKSTCNLLFRELRKKGIQMCLDNFGTGFHGINLFSDYNFDIVKLDKSFILGLGEVGTHERFRPIKLLLDMIAGMNKKSVIIGVESQDVENMILGLNSNEVQGNLYHQPVPLKDLSF